MRLCVLSSGSKGNCVWIEAGGRALVVDSGLSLVETRRRAAAAGLDIGRAKAILVTHEHGDHVRGVGPMARKLGIPVYATAGTAEAAGSQLSGCPILRSFEAGDELDLGFLKVSTISSSHDAADPIVLTASEPGGAKMGLATDLGTATSLVLAAFRELDALVLEANHDLPMLLDGPYPWWLKQRVRGRQGHLSNEQASEALAECLHEGLSRIVLAHLSEVNNTPEAALSAIRLTPGLDFSRVAVAGQWAPTAVFDF